jgi:hypothetical protein
MATIKISQERIDEHIEKIGVDIRPAIECRMERQKLFDFSNALVEKWPRLFESIVQSANEFSIRKKFIFPGKGEADIVTLGITARGPVFIFPRILSVFQEETDLGSSEEVVYSSLKLFHERFPHIGIVRVGQVNEYIFDLGPMDSMKFLAEHFTKIKVPVNGELRLRINRPSDDYNRIIDMQATKKIERTPEMPGADNIVGYGLKVTVDFNNRDASKPIDDTRIRAIIYESTEFNKTDLYTFLNCERGGDAQ